MAELKEYREIGVFDLLSAPLNPIGAFDAEQFKKGIRELLDVKPDDKFVAVDLTGLDFVYSDAYNAFLQFQKELSERGGMLALLSNRQTLMDGLKRSGLDHELKVFASETEMMNFSPRLQEAAEEEPSKESSPQDPAMELSQNEASSEVAEVPSCEQETVVKSDLSKGAETIEKNAPSSEQQSTVDLHEDKPASKKMALIVVAVVLLAAAVGAFFLL